MIVIFMIIPAKGMEEEFILPRAILTLIILNLNIIIQGVLVITVWAAQFILVAVIH